jgi:hypothetical protein
MSGRLAIVPLIIASALIAAASPPAPVDPATAPVEKLNDKPPIPPENNKQTADLARLRINKQKAIFSGSPDKNGVVQGGIEDNRPLASEKQNPDEYRAITEVMLHAVQFEPANLAEHGRRDLTPDDLTYSARFQFRLDLIRFEGKVVKARRLLPTKSLEETGLKEMFEAWLVPEDESPAYPLCLLLARWPEEFAKLPEIPAGQAAGASVTIDKWAAFGGYSFKLMTYPGPAADPSNPTGPGWLKAPLLIGKSVVPTPEPAPTIALDKNLRVFKEIREDTKLSPSRELWEQFSAWNRVFMHVRRFTSEQLEAAANRKIGFAELFENHRDYRLDLIYFQGRLVRLTEGKETDRLSEAGAASWYLAWIIPDGEPSGHPFCAAILDLPQGLQPQAKGLLDVPVSFAGYSFKRMLYESGEKDKKDPTKNVYKLAPFLIGRSVTLRPVADTTSDWSWNFVPAVVGAVIALGGAGLLMSWWFRSGDRAARAEIEANRGRNPFNE